MNNFTTSENLYKNGWEGKYANLYLSQKEKANPIPAKTDNNIQYVDYSAKAFALIGNTQEIKETLKNLGGKFNPRLSCGAGWIFSKKREKEVRSYFAI